MKVLYMVYILDVNTIGKQKRNLRVGDGDDGKFLCCTDQISHKKVLNVAIGAVKQIVVFIRSSESHLFKADNFNNKWTYQESVTELHGFAKDEFLAVKGIIKLEKRIHHTYSTITNKQVDMLLSVRCPVKHT